MDFRLADTFTDSLARLTGEEQKAVKAAALDLQSKGAAGTSFQEIEQAGDKNFRSARVSGDLEMIVHQTAGRLLLCYAGHHDAAGRWAGRRKLETHPKTGAAQWVEIRATAPEVIGPALSAGQKAIFAENSEEELLGYGVPAEWLADVRKATGETLPGLTDHLPGEAAEALLELAAGGKPRVLQLAAHTANPFTHPDARRRFRAMPNGEELRRALDFPGEKWALFPHSEQRQWAERDFAGPARVSGSAGTGKTSVALQRAAYLAEAHPDARILLTTFSDTLAHGLATKLRPLLTHEPRGAERIEVHSIGAIGLRLYQTHIGAATVVSGPVLRELMRQAAGVEEGHKFGFPFLLSEWEELVDAWQLDSCEAYRDVARLGRKTRLPEKRRIVLWSIFERLRADLKTRKLITSADLFTSLGAVLERKRKALFDFIVADESQDLSVAHLRFIAALGGNRANALFFAGDLGQRIVQQPFSWMALGVEVRGRTRNLRVNYRTSHQIRSRADRLLGPAVSDVDGNSEHRRDTVSVFNGPAPEIHALKSQMEESKTVSAWLVERRQGGVLPHEFGVFVRSSAELDRARAAVQEAGMRFQVLEDHVETISAHVSICTMHLAKGLEFRAVVVMACDDKIIPPQECMEAVGDDAERKEVHDAERRLLYVACTRARDHLLVTCVAPGSELLDDLRA